MLTTDRLREDIGIPPANLCKGYAFTSCCASDCGRSYSRVGYAGMDGENVNEGRGL